MLTAGRLLVMTAFAPAVRRVTRESALERNRQVAALAAEVVVPYVAARSPLAALLEKSALAGRRHPSDEQA